MDYDLEESEFARTVLARGSRRLAVTDHSKFGRRGLVRICTMDGVSALVTDRAPPADIADALAASGARLEVASVDGAGEQH